jgi:hypothetical protein
MSRSSKKNPIGPIASAGRGIMKLWKRQCNKRIRKNECHDGSDYKKITDTWDSPTDGKTRFEKNKKNLRK